MKEYFKKIYEKIKFWLTVSRHFSLPQTVLPYLFAVILAYKTYEINYALSLLGLIGVIFAHLGINIIDDYYDWKSGAVTERKKLIDGGMRSRENKCFYLENNLTTVDKIFKIAVLMCLAALLIGIYIAFKIGFVIILIAAIAGFLGLFYSAPPFGFSYHGLGEVVLGLLCGPLLMTGAYVTASGHLDFLILFTSFIIGLLIINILHTHAIMDFDSDESAGRISLAVYLKSKDNAIVAQFLILAFVYLLFLIGIITGVYPLFCVLVFVTVPKAVGLVRLMESDRNVRQPWMGWMENWEYYQQEGLDWFMLRWYISRNLLVDFAVILGVTYLIG